MMLRNQQLRSLDQLKRSLGEDLFDGILDGVDAAHFIHQHNVRSIRPNALEDRVDALLIHVCFVACTRLQKPQVGRIDPAVIPGVIVRTRQGVKRNQRLALQGAYGK